jgi:hypothetical protein
MPVARGTVHAQTLTAYSQDDELARVSPGSDGVLDET